MINGELIIASINLTMAKTIPITISVFLLKRLQQRLQLTVRTMILFMHK